MKYSIGVILIAIIVGAIQFIIITKGTKIISFGTYTPIILFLISAVCIPVIGLNIIIKKIIKNNENIKISKLLTGMTIINIILILIFAIFVIYIFCLIPNNGKLLVININRQEANLLTQEIMGSFGQTQKNLFIITNLKNIIELIVISVIYTSILMTTYVRNKINKIMGIDKEARTKQVTLPIIITISITIIGVLGYIGLNVTQNNIEKTATITGQIFLKRDLSNQEKEDIEKQIKENDKIISYEYISKEDALNSMKEKLKENYLSEDFFQESYTITFLDRDSEEVEKNLKKVKGIEKFTKSSLIR